MPGVKRIKNLTPERRERTTRSIYISGDVATVSGLYQVTHSHLTSMYFFVPKGRLFPRCGRCSNEIYFWLLRPVSSIDEDMDFIPASDPSAS